MIRKAERAVKNAEEKIASIEEEIASMEGRIAAGECDPGFLEDYAQRQKSHEEAMPLWERASEEYDGLIAER